MKTNNKLGLKMSELKKDLDSPSVSNEIPSDARTSSFFIGNCFAIVSLVIVTLAVSVGFYYKYNESKILEKELEYVRAQLSNAGVTRNNLEIESQSLEPQARCIKILVYELDAILAGDKSGPKLPFSNFKNYVDGLTETKIVELLGTDERLETLKKHFDWIKNKARVIIFSRYMKVENIEYLFAKMKESAGLSTGYIEVYKIEKDEGMGNLLEKLTGKDKTLRPNQVFFSYHSDDGADTDEFHLERKKIWLTNTDLRNIEKIVENTGCEYK